MQPTNHLTPPTVHLIVIGNELLNGKRCDRHVQTVASGLARRGVELTSCEFLRDEPQAVSEAIQRRLSPGALIITTGGLGPTLDDLTRESIAAACGVKLRMEQSLWDDLQARYARGGRTLSDSNRSQILVPEQGCWLVNHHGTAPGLVFEPVAYPQVRVVALPGPPRELNPMWEQQALPYLAEQYGWKDLPYVVSLRFATVPEATIDHALRPILAPYPEVEISSLIRVGRVDITLSLPCGYQGGRELLHKLGQAARELFPRQCYCYHEHVAATETVLPDFETVILDRLRQRGETVATAESCTGGMVAAAITAIPGSSAVFQGSMVVYQNKLKTAWLHVPEDVLAEVGAVSEPVVRTMVEQVREQAGADWGIALSGIAGPDGGSQDKPVGTVWAAVGNHSSCQTERFVFPGDRSDVRDRAVVYALQMLWDRIQ